MKQNRIINSVIIVGIFGIVTFCLNSCIKKNFDNPPDLSGYDPKLHVTHTLAQLLAKYPPGSKIDSDVVIYGIVEADDRSGNFYKEIVIEDSTAGLQVLIDAYSLYNDYPVGRKIYINCKGLVIGQYGGAPQLGLTFDMTGAPTNIPANLMSTCIVKADFPHMVVPLKVPSMAALANHTLYLNRLVELDSVEFTTQYAGLPYAQPAAIASGTSTYIEDCSGLTAEVYTSGYANFFPSLTPIGKGRFIGIYTVYNNTPELIIRDTTDLKMTDPRCSGSAVSTSSLISMDSLKNMYVGSTITLPAVKIRGIVISDLQGGDNLSSNKSVYLQSGTKGINIFFAAGASFSLNDSIEIDLTGATLQSYNGTLEVSGMPVSAARKLGVGNITPRIVTTSLLNANYNDYECTLVQINNAALSGGSTFSGSGSGNLTLTDATGSITLYTNKYASFLTNSIPSGSKNFVGIIARYNTNVELLLRNTGDIQ